MVTLGVTGGIGSGKSTVCAILQDHGAVIFDADREARRIMEEDAGVRSELIDAFGAEAFDVDGRLNRAYLAQRVFNDEGELARLNAIVHPRVFDAFQRLRDATIGTAVELLVHEAALLYESGGDRYVDLVVVVHAPVATRIARTTARDGSRPEDVLARMQHQMPSDELLSRADIVIHNDGSLDELRLQVDELVERVTTSERKSDQ